MELGQQFILMCVYVVITVCILLVSGAIGFFNDKNSDGAFTSWMLCAVGLGGTITYILYTFGVF